MEARFRARGDDFARLGLNVGDAFDLVPNVVNTKSIIYDESDVGCRLVELLALPRDRHVMAHSDDTTEEFDEKCCQSLAVVSVYCA